MLIFFTLFSILFSFWIVLFIFSGVINSLFLLIGMIVSFLISLFIFKTKLYNERTEFLCLQFGFYRLIFRKVLASFGENIYIAFQFLRSKGDFIPIVDYLLIDNESLIQNALICGVLNINSGVLACIIKNKCIMIHSLSEMFFTPNQLFFLTIEAQNINDDNLV